MGPFDSDNYDHCWETGEYDDQDCNFCPYNEECSGSSDDED